MNYSIIIPIYNEERSLPSLLDKLEKIPNEIEVIIVDDGSNDQTDIIQLLVNAGAKIDYHDTYVPKLVYNDISIDSIINLESEKLKRYDACVIVTDHSNIDYDMIYDNSQLIIDTRNVYDGKNGNHVKRLGQG